MIKHSSVHHLVTVKPPPITEIYIELYGWEWCDHITESSQQVKPKSVCWMFWCHTNGKSNFAIVVARYEISYGIYNNFIRYSAIPSTCLRSICLYLVTSFPGLSDNGEGTFLHIKMPTCPGNKVVYSLTAWKFHCGC